MRKFYQLGIRPHLTILREEQLDCALKEKAELQGEMQTMQASHKQFKEELKESI